ncbi:7 transmembrane sweet-taste receptor of 3 GCPR-domain-containing protein [Catenaria anguillulae PL171]|uniref:7 transmembrane sweet-taste receptor of 3 GCPR-domain-containing protein n=1 Tax=Catenaria anguillulae PL171 TaxID=765915 RepID=A0A1Y2HPV3_9FUNG|nr:7 transmembrane sweet-taste receptor of 3 GCPR-domain-containing protein [Catenaria anguillulae PL171]
MQIGFLLIYLSLFLFVGRPTESMCMARPFVLSVGFSLVIGLLLAKTFRLYRLFHSAAIRTKNRSGISDQTVFLHGSSIVAVNLLICIIWAGVDPPKPKELFIAEGRTNMVCMGQGADAAISAVLIAYNVILIVCGVALGFLTRNIQARFNESKSIGLAMYNLTALAAIGLPLLYATGSDLNLTFSVLGVLIIIGSFLLKASCSAPKSGPSSNPRKTLVPMAAQATAKSC